MNTALIIAGGSGARMHQDIPKQFLTVNEKPVIVYTLEAFQKAPEIDVIAVVCISGWEQVLWAYANQFNITKLKHVVPGGENGQASIRNGVFELEKNYSKDDVVLIHDAIRPMVSEEIISDCIVKTKQFGCAIASVPCAEAMLETEDGILADKSYPRENLKRTQTPQGFHIGDICELHRNALEKGITNSVASCTLMIEMGQRVYFSAGSEKNIKLTTVEDIDIFKALLLAKRSEWLK
ncbi:IspD/TarI family cytidylyltransferase [Murimonas intestini]|uniref:2-C-methyl-D-erythritol 4-phosphate cytidylyltransferase n=2 Tax=Murimonas intestini TaxID=1337051 RepID=A0AB73SXR7_9FIRM|nr:IspD/TarI family cytidylyltransferase [Murimonas intestini]MCR1843317.1 2-C-methyl-D-erythritol 4-phosphate cytidylyltransferase [Murimonas intestini]MCR1865732.1 2-C-methyl-D-erythritol 4-phosphate cytidylyltransferase [Murimonas intestini]MCR1886149.1 2-C-methyl-D-erythritol 4-phosphate cytidylyltransferase [Murimonas intestini]